MKEINEEKENEMKKEKEKEEQKNEDEDYNEETYYKEIIRLGLDINPKNILDENSNIDINSVKMKLKEGI